MNLTFGQKIKAMRLERGMTQTEMVNLFHQRFGIKLSVPGLSQYEADKRTPDRDVVVKLAEFYAVSLDWLYGTDGVQEVENDVDPKIMAVFRDMKKLNDEEKDQLFKMVKVLFGEKFGE